MSEEKNLLDDIHGPLLKVCEIVIMDLTNIQLNHLQREIELELKEREDLNKLVGKKLF